MGKKVISTSYTSTILKVSSQYLINQSSLWNELMNTTEHLYIRHLTVNLFSALVGRVKLRLHYLKHVSLNVLYKYVKLFHIIN